MKDNPKAALEDDLKAVLVGLVIACMGSLIVGGNVYWNKFSTQPGPALPILGTIIFALGIALVGVGIVVAILCIAVKVWVIFGRRNNHEHET